MDLLTPIGDAAANRSVEMTPAVQLSPCLTDSDSLLRFSAYSSVLLGAQALWWKDMTTCAPAGSAKFEIVSGINVRVAQWAEPLFMRKGPALPSGHWLRDGARGGGQVDAAEQGRVNKPETEAIVYGQTVPPFGPTDFMVTAVWSTSSVQLPPLRGAVGSNATLRPSLVKAIRPGGDPAAIVQGMDEELVIVQLRNVTADGDRDAGRCKGSELVQGQDCITYDSVLWILSTDLSAAAGGAPVRQLNVTLRSDVWATHPIEPDAFQGFSTDCNLNWLGSAMPLRLPGGSVQLVSYSLGPALPKKKQQGKARARGGPLPRRMPVEDVHAEP